MGEEELMNILVSYAGEDYKWQDGDYLHSLIHNAIAEICRELHRNGFASVAEFEKCKKHVLAVYPDLILQIAEFHFDKRGKEGVASYTENGVQNNYEGVGTPRHFFAAITPIAQII